MPGIMLLKKTFLFTCLAVLFCFDCASAEPIDGLAHRILGGKASKFVFSIDDSAKDYFRIEQKGPSISITGDCTVSQAEGLNWYLKHVAGVHVSWYADQPVELPCRLPDVEGVVERKASVGNRFFLNYCTFGYTLPWWGWKDWERLVDWMALNGINMPFSLTGQESVWMEVWKEFGMTEDRIRAYFSGPAHLPWHRMANLDGFQGPLPYSWMEDQKEMELKIIGRERELGMTPVLPAFAGHVPEDIKDMYPDADIKNLSSWCGFKPTFFMNAEDPLFAKIQKAYIEKQTEMYGTDHIYGFDPFNEMDPPSWEPEYLAKAGKNIYSTLAAADPEAKWLQMGWLFYYQRKDWTNDRIEAYLTSVPDNNLYILDYFCESVEVWRNTEAFYGQPYIFCYLGNFGGNTKLQGDISKLNGQLTALSEDAGSNLLGIGSTLEAFDCSPQIYEYLFDRIWGEGKDVDSWYRDWAKVRAGKSMENAEKAWEILSKDVYVDKSPYWTLYGRGVLSVIFPMMEKSDKDYTAQSSLDENARLLEAVGMLLSKPSKRDAYRYDIVILLSQYLSNSFRTVHARFVDAYEAKDVEEMKNQAAIAAKLFADMDAILNTHPNFMLGKWIADARAKGVTPEEKDYYEKNARTLLTTWGDTGSELDDYASRVWGGLMGGYYVKRWQIMFDEAISCVEDGREYSQDAVNAKVFEFEKAWTDSTDKYPSKPQGNTIRVARKILKNLASN